MKMDYLEMIDHIAILIYGVEYDPKLGPQTGRITYCNKIVSEFIGYTEAEIVDMGFGFYKITVHPDDLYKTTKSISSILNSDKKEHTEYYRVKAKYGKKYEILKGILRIVEPIPSEGPIKFVVTTLFATTKEILEHYPDIDMNDELFNSLSKREKEIAFFITKGGINKEIADKLCISILTVKKHRSNIRKKLHVKNTAEMVAYLAPYILRH